MTVPVADVTALVESARSGSRPALARLLTLVERGGLPAQTISRSLVVHADSSFSVGLTGPPGAGKSTLTNALVGHIRSLGTSVGVLAVDPSSPFSGGAILGDRVRLQGHATDEGVFIRSLASRGHLGGLSVAVPSAARVYAAMGMPWVLIETVGVGQAEVEIAGHADTTVVVLNPGWGDSIQANKAGVIEIADVFVINKADRDGVAALRADLDQMLGLVQSERGTWQPPVVETIATTGSGIPDLWSAINNHRAHIEANGMIHARRERRQLDELEALTTARVLELVRSSVDDETWTAVLDRLRAGTIDIWEASDALVSRVERSLEATR